MAARLQNTFLRRHVPQYGRLMRRVTRMSSRKRREQGVVDISSGHAASAIVQFNKRYSTNEKFDSSMSGNDSRPHALSQYLVQIHTRCAEGKSSAY